MDSLSESPKRRREESTSESEDEIVIKSKYFTEKRARLFEDKKLFESSDEEDTKGRDSKEEDSKDDEINEPNETNEVENDEKEESEIDHKKTIKQENVFEENLGQSDDAQLSQLDGQSDGQSDNDSTTIDDLKDNAHLNSITQESPKDVKLEDLLALINKTRISAQQLVRRPSEEVHFKTANDLELFTSSQTASKETVSSNFELIIGKVLDDFETLFNHSQMKFIIDYLLLEKLTKSLFLLLILRKNIVFSISSVNLPNINKDRLRDELRKLESKKLLIDCTAEVTSSEQENIPKKLGSSKKAKYFKVNPLAATVFWKILLLNFQPQPFNNDDVFSHYFKLIKNLNEPTFRSKFVDKKIKRTVEIYDGSEEIDSFVDACFMESHLNDRHIADISTYSTQLLDRFEEHVKRNFDKDIHLVDYLRRLTAGDRLASCLSLLADKLISNQEYPLAVVLLRFLAEQEIYGLNEMGSFYYRLIDVLDQHLDKTEAKECCEKALSIQTVAKNWKYQIRFKLREIDEIPKRKDVDVVNVNLSTSFQVMKEQCKESKKSDFDILREVALIYYKESEGLEGIKCEGGFFNIIFFCLFFDELFIEMDDVFRFQFQKFPLDYESKYFLTNRTTHIRSRHKALKEMKIKQIIEIIKSVHSKKRAYLETLTKKKVGFETMKEIIEMLGVEDLFAILEAIIQSYVLLRDSCPNLIVWNKNDEIKFVEDKLLLLEFYVIFKYCLSNFYLSH